MAQKAPKFVRPLDPRSPVGHLVKQIEKFPAVIGSPISLYGRVTVGNNEFAPVNIEAMRNPLKQPIAIREFRFGGTCPLTTGDGPSGTLAFGFFNGESALVSMKVGKHQITATPIPLHSFGRSESVRWENGDGALSQSSGQGAADVGIYRWKLAQPMVVLPGEVIEIVIHHRGLTEVPITIGVCAAGHTLVKLPKDRIVPTVLGVVRDVTIQSDTITGSSFDTNERDLINMMGSTMEVERLGGRFSVVTAYEDPGTGLYRIHITEGGPTITDPNSIVVPPLDPTPPGEPASSPARVTIRDYRGFLIADRVPFRSLFDAYNRAWDTRFKLPVNGFLKMTVEYPIFATNEFMPARGLVSLSVVGHRKV